jgi:hypothetical protein
MIATVTQIHCGVPGDDITQLNIRRAKSWFSVRRGIVVVIDGIYLVTFHWDSDTKLTVYLPKSALPKNFVERKVPTQHSNVNGVQIEYRHL